MSKKNSRRNVCKDLCGLSALTLIPAEINAREIKAQPAPVSNPAELDSAVEDHKITDAVRNGATMEEIAKLRDPLARNPQEAIQELKNGNYRFFTGSARRPELSAAVRRAQILAQTPFAIVLSCSDSRVPTEIIFDQGLGSLFITRVAGNIIESGTLGSIEYGVEHLKTHLVVVMGHEGCGAVKAALQSPEERAKESANIQSLLNQIVPSVSKLPKIRDKKAKMREAVIANVCLQVKNLKESDLIQKAVSSNKIAIIGAYYEITSGVVDFFETEQDLRVSQPFSQEIINWRPPLA